MARLSGLAIFLLLLTGSCYAAKKKTIESDIIEDVDGKKLENLLEEEEFLAVFFYTRTCQNCNKILEELEKIDDEAERFGVSFVRNGERPVAKKYGVTSFPALVYFRNKEPAIYDGDLMNEDQVLEWLTDLESMDLPDKIEEVNAKILQNLLNEEDFVAVLFYKDNCKKCDAALHELEQIDDEADQEGISFVKIYDESLSSEYGLDELPALVYYRKKIPIVYDGDLEREEHVLDWLLEFKEIDDDDDDDDDDNDDDDDDDDEDDDDDDVIEAIGASALEKMLKKKDCVAVLFYDDDDKESKDALKELENIDDDADKHGIPFVKIDNPKVAESYGIDDHELPQLVYFENNLPNFYQGDLEDEQEVLEWLIHQKQSDEIEDVSDVVLEKMIETSDHLAVLFYDKEDDDTEAVLKELENIDDEADKEGITILKIDDDKMAELYGIEEDLPVLVYFENKIPSVYEGDLLNEEEVLQWLVDQVTSDEIEEVTDEILDMLLDKNEYVAVLFYDDSKQSEKVLMELESIDDDCDKHGIVFVKTDDPEAAEKYGIEEIPTVVLFEDEIPNIYEGDLMKEEEVMEWFLEEMATDEIEDVSEKMLLELIDDSESLAVLFYDKDSPRSSQVLAELENIDDECDSHDIPFVKIDDESIAKDFGFDDELPILVYFEDKIPTMFEGDLKNEEQVLEWLVHHKTEDTIEEVTEEILEDLVDEREYVLVFFAPEDCGACDDILEELEHIDDDLDDHGILFVTTEDIAFAKKHAGIGKFPALVLFRNGNAVPYKGDLMNEDDILAWVTDEDTLENPDEIDEVNSKMLKRILDRNDFVAVLFYKEKCPECDKVMHELENIDDEAEDEDIDFVKVSDIEVAEEYKIVSFPTLIFFRKRFPQIYAGNLKKEEEVLKWLVENKSQKDDVIEDVDRNMLESLMEDADHLVVLFYDTACKKCDIVLKELENIDDDTDRLGIHFVKMDDDDYAKDLGITSVPALVYFEDEIPSIFDGDLENEEEVLEWLVKQKSEDTIENVNRELLNKMIAETDYLAVLFYVDDDEDSEEIILYLEEIDDDCSDYEVHLVKIVDNLMAKKYGIRNPPGLVFFRRGKPLKYPGDLFDNEEVLEWLTNPENMEMKDAIEKVNKRMFERIVGRTSYLAVLFYSKNDCKQCVKILEELEKIDDEAEAAGIKFVKIDDQNMAKDFGVYALPALMFIKNADKDNSVIYTGDMKKGEKILEWLMDQKDPSADFIEDVDGDTLVKMLHSHQHLAVYFYNKEICQICEDGSMDKPDCSECRIALEDLENIDDDTDRHGIQFVKTDDLSVARDYGVHQFPALIYFENMIPSVYEGDLSVEEEVLLWLVQQRTEDTIEAVNRELLERLILESHYLAVLFYKPHCRPCDQVIKELENIDDEADIYGIHMVKIQDTVLAKRYGIKTYPALLYFRNGNPLMYDGDLKNEDSVIEWLTDDENRELADEIESVNSRMLERLIQESPFLAVFFYDDDCEDCDEVLKELEKIDDMADGYGIDFVKINDVEAASKYNVHSFPTLAYFRRQTPVVFDGDLLNEQKVIAWLTNQDVFELRDQIEEVNRKMLDKLMEENDYVAVYFYENDCDECDTILHELEHIDDEADDLDILFVKIKDNRYARKYGITRVPALVYFRKKFPSIYRGDLMVEEEVLEWLHKNRYRHSEVNLFMYSLIAVTLSFVLYSVCFIFCFKNKEKKE